MYEECPYAFQMKKSGVVGDSNAPAEIGSFAHYLLEQLFKGNMDADSALNACVEEFDLHISSPISEASKDKKYMALCEYFSDFDMSDYENYEILGVEKKIKWKIDKYSFIGFIDLVLKDKKSGTIYLIDHKSSPHFLKKDGTPLKAQAEQFNRYKKQMYLYADAMKAEYGILPDKICWNHFLDDGKVTEIDFNEEDYRKSIEWATDLIEKILKDKTFEACTDNYLRCHVLCDYRNGLCEYKELDPDDFADEDDE